jgi:hypothetical protein
MRVIRKNRNLLVNPENSKWFFQHKSLSICNFTALLCALLIYLNLGVIVLSDGTERKWNVKELSR